MLHFSRLATASILAVLLAALIVVIPNFFSKSTVDSWPAWLPKGQIVLGLDLQGGSYLLFEVDREQYVAQRLNTLATEVRDALAAEPRIGFSGLNRQQIAESLVVQVRINPEDLGRLDEVRSRLEAIRSPLTAAAFGGATYEFDLTVTEDGIVRMAYNPTALTQRVRDITQQSIEVIERRINALGTVEPNIQREGEDRIVVEAPGDGDPTRLLDIIGQTAQMTFHLVRQPLQAPAGVVPQPTTPDGIVYPDADQPGLFYELDPTPLLTGEQLIDARATFQQPTNQPVVSFRFNSTGARIFAETTAANTGRQFAIVLDNQVITAPRINEPILGGSGVIEGGFTTETANNLAILLRAGALPARLEVVEQRSVGPSLGADSIRAGIIAMVVATVAIAVFMIFFYGLLGVFAVIALIAQNVLMLSILTVLGATLTLPGIAGIVLTMAMGVDANVLIYERMREEAKAGRSTVAAIDQGFRRALATIVDSHLTALIAAIALFVLGTGPIRGFAITLAIGIVSTLFTAYLITRMIVVFWYRTWRPKTVPL